ncbi:hypothetical protein [Actinophytocola sp. KF-1]
MSAPPPAVRRGLTHPAAALLLAPAAVALALAGWAVAVWAVLGGLAGYTLSGSV